MAILRLLHQQRSLLEKNLDAVKPWISASYLSAHVGSQKLNFTGSRYSERYIRQKSSHAPASLLADGKASEAAQPLAIRDQLDLTFNDARQAYRSKSTWEILRAYIVFRLCSVEYLVENNQKVSSFAWLMIRTMN